LEALEKERPLNPIEFFSYYLITHNPYSKNNSNNAEVKLPKPEDAEQNN